VLNFHIIVQYLKEEMHASYKTTMARCLLLIKVVLFRGGLVPVPSIEPLKKYWGSKAGVGCSRKSQP
jgi:hypothetical protein